LRSSSGGGKGVVLAKEEDDGRGSECNQRDGGGGETGSRALLVAYGGERWGQEGETKLEDQRRDDRREKIE